MESRSRTNGYPGKPLKTDYPLSEKDEQAWCQENLRKLQKEALKRWRLLNRKIK